MAKRFEDFQAHAENYSDFQKVKTPPIAQNLFVDDYSPEEMQKKSFLAQSITLLSSAGLSIVTAPFVATQISLQLSILSHKNTFTSAKGYEENLLKQIPQEFTPNDKRRYELMIRSGVLGHNKPYSAPVYTSYKEAFQALANQGLFGFYKGNLLGLLHVWTNSFLRLQAFNLVDSQNFEILKQGGYPAKALNEVTVLTLVDILTHPIQLMQSRFILQNRLPNFSIYKSIPHFLKQHFSNPRTMFQGIAVHLPKNIIFTIGQENLLKDRPMEGFLLSSFLSQTLSYPLMTVLRRLHCQDNLPGMLPYKYTGLLNGLKTIFKEEGVKGVFRGYLAFTGVQFFSTLLVLNTSTMMQEMSLL